jgi:hypothetical protein
MAAGAGAGGGFGSSARADLVHEWKLDEPAGATSAVDTITSSIAGVGGTSSWTSAKLNNGFKTTGGSVGFVNAGNVGVDGSFSLSFWVKPEDVSLDWRNMVSKHDTASKSFWLGQNQTDGTLRFGLYFDGTNESPLDTSVPVVGNNNWSFVTATWNEATKLQSIYVDGALRASATRAGQSFTTPRSSNLLFNTNSTSLSSGAGTGSWARFGGTLDDVALWDNALTSGEIKAMYNTASTPGLLANYDAQSFAALRQAYLTNFPAQVGNMRWTRATGLTAGEGAVLARPNGYVMQLNAAGVGVTALSTVSLSFDPEHTNIADTTSASENPGGSGADLPAVHVFGNGSSEIDGLTSNASIGSADIRPDGAVSGDVLVMLWLQDTSGADDRATLRTELSGAGGSLYSVLDSSSPLWTELAPQYAGFDTLLRFDNASPVGAFNWDFATHTDVVVDQLAVRNVNVPEPSALLWVGVVTLVTTMSRRHRWKH